MTSQAITFGRQLIDGVPVGDGITLDADGATAPIINEIDNPIISNPISNEYIGILDTGADTGGEYARALAIYPPGNSGPPEHFHPNYEERFEVVEGEFVFTVDGEPTTLSAGEELTVPAGTPHTFRNASTELATAIGEARPAGQIEAVIMTLFGLAHERKLSEDGNPRFLQAMAMTPELKDDTVFVSPPPWLQNVLATVFAPVARLAGYRATYPKYLEESFWEEHVEQPN